MPDCYLCDEPAVGVEHVPPKWIESYHQLRSAIAQVGGKKELTGRTDIGIFGGSGLQPQLGGHYPNNGLRQDDVAR